jgi:XTP/dITP diphosphohydrolase
MRRLTGGRLIVATHNRGKLEEISQLIAPWNIRAVGAAELGLPEPEETETSFLGNARIKAHAAATAIQGPALADDSGIEVEALGGAPGVYTANWAETPNGRDFMVAMTRTHDALRAREAAAPWRARFRATMVLAWPDGEDAVFEGEVSGHLVWPVRGRLGHGYDPMFVPDGDDRTFAEMPAGEKNRISHRAMAFRKFAQFLGENDA